MPIVDKTNNAHDSTDSAAAAGFDFDVNANIGIRDSADATSEGK